jgi:hypothetical protein
MGSDSLRQLAAITFGRHWSGGCQSRELIKGTSLLVVVQRAFQQLHAQGLHARLVEERVFALVGEQVARGLVGQTIGAA